MAQAAKHQSLIPSIPVFGMIYLLQTWFLISADRDYFCSIKEVKNILLVVYLPIQAASKIFSNN
jgi:hypothetical protein